MAKSQLVDVHPLADIFPLLEGDAFADLMADIKANGLVHPIVTLDRKILDGRNRYRACNQSGVPARFEALDPATDPLAYVISANLKRRHLNESQRAMIAQKLETTPHGGNRRGTDQDAKLHVDRKSAADLLHVSTRSIADAKKVQDKGTPELIARVESGEVAVSLAAKLAALPDDQQKAACTLPEAALRSAVKSFTRQAREVRLSDATAQASRTLGSKLYSVIYADPPWRFEPYSRKSGMDRAADNHYPTMTVDALCKLKPPANPDCVLFLWATAPMLLEALDVLDAWGFAYKSHFIWNKDRVGTGYWTRSRHELLLIATKGKIPAPAPGEQFDSVIAAAVGEHSEKPMAFAEMIEEMFPHARPLEMFARVDHRAGWDIWGNQAGGAVDREVEGAVS